MRHVATAWVLCLSGALLTLAVGCGDQHVNTLRNASGLPSDDEALDKQMTTTDDKPSAGELSVRNKGRKIARRRESGAGLTQEELEEQMEALGYLAESNRSPGQSGVTVHDTSQAYAGLSLYISSHAPEAYLIDMAGKELHTWRHEFERVWPDANPPKFLRPQNMNRWRRVYLYPNGDLLAIFSYHGMIKIDRDSNLVWSYPGNCHHDLCVAEDGTIYVLGVDVTYGSAGDRSTWTLEPVIDVLGPDGSQKERMTVLPFFRNSNYAPLLDNMQNTGDLLHLNTIEVFDGSVGDKSDLFRAGNILISSRKLSFVAILDANTKKAVWALPGMWQEQHEPTLLANGNMLLFDNRSRERRSQVVEFDPFTQHVAWLYNGTDSDPLWSPACSIAQRLPNGNTLITETHGARAIEVTPEGGKVWEFINPHLVKSDNAEKVAAMFMLVRLTSGEWPDWL